MSKQPFKVGDFVWHRPTRTTWTVASYHDGFIERKGIVGVALRASECRLLDRPTKEERKQSR